MQRNQQTATGITIPASLSERPPLLEYGLQTTEPASNEMMRTIAVLLDGSPAAELALPFALAIARQSGASLRLVRAYSRLDDIDPWQFSQAAARIKPSKLKKQGYLAEFARTIIQTEDLETETVLIDSPDTVDALLCGVAGANLVVIGSRRRRWLSRLWWLNTVDQLRRRMAVPLLLTGDSMPANETAKPFTNIVVPLDGSVLARAALGPAAQLASLSGGSLSLLNVQDRDWSLGSFEHTDPRSYLLSVSHQLQHAGVRAKAEILPTIRDTGPAIASYAKARDADLIAIATRGDYCLSRLMRGSTADYLLRNTKLPILLQNVPVAEKRPELTSVS
jgi:nucleotide-binding universal stress UspA family protein